MSCLLALFITDNRCQGSYRELKVLNVLGFYDFIQLPLNVLEFVLNVLDIFESCYC